MANPTATLSTSLGDVEIELFTDKMPLTAGNFIKLAKAGFYDGLHFHRVLRVRSAYQRRATMGDLAIHGFVAGDRLLY